MESYEAQLIDIVARLLETLPIPGLRIQKIRVEGAGAAEEIVLVFHRETPLGGRLGFRFPAWDESLGRTDADQWSAVVWANLDEAINATDWGSSIAPDPDGIAWIPPCEGED
ncbi:hypothetical protein [Sinosporangium siamense]|nr:hypothetical protein [Sinosporangium siamense]